LYNGENREYDMENRGLLFSGQSAMFSKTPY